MTLSTKRMPLPTNRIFVVPFRAQPAGAPRDWAGRVEHVVSGQMPHCHSLEEQLVCMRRVLADMPASSSVAGIPCNSATYYLRLT
jgi:hypothetical protein